MLASTQPNVAERQLLDSLTELGSCVVAFSGGVDSSVVAKAAQLALGDRAVAVTGVSASLAREELQIARRMAEEIGIRHLTVPTEELQADSYVANQANRCWHCKDELYRKLEEVAEQLEMEWIVNGTNFDDTHEFRPGLRAAAQHRVRSPLAECGFDKGTVRMLALSWELEVWDKPASPCLASRLVYGLEVTPERLQRVERAEEVLRELGLRNTRVRYHQDDLARLEVLLPDLPRMCEEDARTKVVSRLRELGFKYVTLDLEGFRSGSYTQLVSAEQLLGNSGDSP